MPPPPDLARLGITVPTVLRNPSPAKLYEEALRNEEGTAIASSGALVARSGERTGRSPLDKRIVENPATRDELWWGNVNIPLADDIFVINRERAVDYLNTRKRLLVVDGYAGADPRHRIKVRLVCERAYHALFMWNMLIRPTPADLDAFGEPDFVLLNAGRFPANRHTKGMTSKTSVDICFERREMVILGTEYAGEMKKGVFTIMNYLLPKRGVLSMHCSANEGAAGDVTLFFGLSGTGKTTLSADPRRRLIGDDEHGWSDDGVFNLEGGCYAKVIDLDAAAEPQIAGAIRFGAVLENVVYDEISREVDYADASITTNTRAAYPIDEIPNAKVPSVGGHPRNIVFLTCDAFGVLPPVARLSAEQAMYHFLSGYTAKVAGTEVGVKEPQATFSACFGAPFLVLPPSRYAALLAERIRRHGSRVWLANTGWTGGGYGVGRRLSIAQTRAVIDAIHAGALDEAPADEDPVFGLRVPRACPGLPDALLRPRGTWADGAAYDRAARSLAARFLENFAKYEAHAGAEVLRGAPRAA